ncbi:hypothetical protein CDD81_199 [Ophiocordyceps australis]|uniref:Uncharacterized protein n=1 Tax=Ophiocordyceps australis TaxID=1399860 RepID=A0A2C5YEK5_9HYPO|nr:hypothetical protein CDD81_199 [Ophiocordyceps australis]
MPEVDFNKLETTIFLLQTSLQAGPTSSDNVARCSHARLCDLEFGKKMHEYLHASVLRKRENWEDISYKWLLKHIKLSISLVCVSTFNVDDGHLGTILAQPEQASILVEASIDIYNNAELLDAATYSLQQIMHDKWVQTLHRARPIFSSSLDSSIRDAALNMAIKKFDGRPLSRLPRDTEPFKDNTAHFGLQKAQGGHDLLVRIVKDGSSLELVPQRVFEGVVEFRPLDDHWVHRHDNWLLSCHGSGWKLAQTKNQVLINPKSTTATLIKKFLSPLEAPLHLYMLFNSKTKLLSIELPRLRLAFSLRHGSCVIRSKQFQSMQIDADQRVGTLIGFASKLVLRDMGDAQVRKIIIPHGKISFDKTHYPSFGAHVTARVNHGTAHRVNTYTIDNLLCRLKDDGTMESKLYLGYAHALASYCIPDPFTGHTGTEQTLSILKSASVHSAFSLSDTALKSLDCIARLAPKRYFYPSHLRVMQTVEWDSSLGSLAQDSRFLVQVNTILDKVSELQSLYDTGPSIKGKLDHAHMDLVKREINTNSTLCVSGFGAEEFTNQYDEAYLPRDCGRRSPQAEQISDIVHRINTGQESRQKCSYANGNGL